jgi:phospholipid/cholesterol/gamma-HCH transport system substrate-binding protein
MAKETNRNLKLGVFVVIVTVLLILALYFIGSRQNLFGSAFRLKARFHNVNGLMQGNNVRFAGIDVGTVSKVVIENDSTVLVVMVIDNKARSFIKKSAIASVGTDGLMGNKLVNINATIEPAPLVEQDDELATLRPLEMDEMVRTLNVTNENILAISGNVRHMTDRINSRNNLWNLLFDTVVGQNLKTSALNLRLITGQGREIALTLNEAALDLKNGKGDLGRLLKDSTLTHGVAATLTKLQLVSDSATTAVGSISYLMGDIKKGKGTIGQLMKDTSLVPRLNKTIVSLDSAATSFDQNMEALHYSWPFKKYFKKRSGHK